MNNCVPDWIMEEDLRSFHELFPSPNDNKSTQQDNELVELLWRNGHVVMQCQNNRKHEHIKPFKRTVHKTDNRLINSCNLIQEDDWLQYTIDDSLENDYGSDLLSDIPTTSKINSSIENKEDKLPPKSSQITSSLVNTGPVNLSHFSRSSSACGSNQDQNQNDVGYILSKEAKENSTMNLPQDEVKASAINTTLTSSSGGSRCSYGRNTAHRSTSSLNHKRKERDGDESECHGEEAENKSMEVKKTSQRKSSTRKSRAAEVHNLSERRRRDRINEKMKALQELIPHCNKSDKASMLDEAIEYLKSLQLQLQLMWMGSGMAPMMFPNVQQYMSRVSMPLINNQFPLIRSPLVNHSPNQMPICSSPNLNSINFPTQIQNAHTPGSYARYFGYPHMQMPPQGMNLYSYGSHTVQQIQKPVVAGSNRSNSMPTAADSSKNIQNGHLG